MRDPKAVRIAPVSVVAGSVVAATVVALSGCFGTSWDATSASASTSASTPTRAAPPAEAMLFDDFTYSSPAELARNGWILRTAAGWPGVPGSIWSDNVEVGVVDPADADNRLMRMTASTDGTTTRQAQFCHQRKYYEGTYAARVRWSDAPASGGAGGVVGTGAGGRNDAPAGPDGDKSVQTFYLISPLKAPLDTDYSETDFEYLPNGGWGSGDLTLFTTTWETFHPEPKWLQINTSTNTQRSRAGWHVLTLQIANGEVTYFIDDEKHATHGGPYYPEEKMSINFNLWFIAGELVRSSEPRRYVQDVDWVYHKVGAVQSPGEVRRAVTRLRGKRVTFVDTVRAETPVLESPCNF